MARSMTWLLADKSQNAGGKDENGWLLRKHHLEQHKKNGLPSYIVC